MGKILALDLGDQWIGIAISDLSCFFARPYSTVKVDDLEDFLLDKLATEDIKTIIIGYPKTMRGRESQQTKKTLDQKDKLELKFPDIKFILWDERLSSKRAESLKPARTKDEKIKSHSIAAAFILDSYLSYLSLVQDKDKPDNQN